MKQTVTSEGHQGMARPQDLFLVVILLLASCCWTCMSSGNGGSKYAFLKDASKVNSSKEYDYIIVGGGASGCPLAATLSQNFSVLVVERGGSPYGVTDIERREGFHMNLINADNNTSPAEKFISEDGVPGYRGRVLGGGTAVNAGFYTRASSEDVKEGGWDGSLVNSSFEWVEAKVAFEPELPTWQRALKHALVESGIGPDNGFTYDHKIGTKVGGVIFDKQGFRHTSADLLEYANPKNIRVLLYATASQILFESHSGNKPRAIGVVFTDKKGNVHKALLGSNKGDVILSAGALGSPQLLILSGIGPAEHLSSLGIPLLVNLPGVGKGMGDNPNNPIVNVQRQGASYSLLQVVGITPFGSFIEELSGGAYAPTVFQALISLLKNPGKVVDLKALSESADKFKDHYSQLVIIFQKIEGPLSRGELKLLSTNVKDNPSVRFNYYKVGRDLERCIGGIRQIAKATKAPAFKNLTFEDDSLMPSALRGLADAVGGLIPKDLANDTSVEQFCRDSLTTIWHTHGGCIVGSVVDSEYRVYGVDGLRVVDISTFKSSPGTNPQATLMMLGRYTGLQIIAQRSES